MNMLARPVRRAMLLAALCGNGAAIAQQLDTRFSCSHTRNEDDEKVIYADNGEIRLNGSHIAAFRWESSLFRSTHGFDCSIDDDDGLLAEAHAENKTVLWRIALTNARAARDKRGFNFDRGLNCTIRLLRNGGMLKIKPSCPALCGSRANFTELSVDLNTGKCHYEE